MIITFYVDKGTGEFVTVQQKEEILKEYVNSCLIDNCLFADYLDEKFSSVYLFYSTTTEKNEIRNKYAIYCNELANQYFENNYKEIELQCSLKNIKYIYLNSNDYSDIVIDRETKIDEIMDDIDGNDIFAEWINVTYTAYEVLDKVYEDVVYEYREYLYELAEEQLEKEYISIDISELQG